MLIYTIINPSPFSDTSSDPLESAKRVEYEPEISRSLNSQTLYSLAVLLAIITSPQKIYSHFGRSRTDFSLAKEYYYRVLAIIITMQLFQHGGGCILLENRVLVHIGEVSYSWYLVHWPFAAICKHLEITDHYSNPLLWFNRGFRAPGCLLLHLILVRIASFRLRTSLFEMGEDYYWSAGCCAPPDQWNGYLYHKMYGEYGKFSFKWSKLSINPSWRADGFCWPTEGCLSPSQTHDFLQLALGFYDRMERRLRRAQQRSVSFCFIAKKCLGQNFKSPLFLGVSLQEVALYGGGGDQKNVAVSLFSKGRFFFPIN